MNIRKFTLAKIIVIIIPSLFIMSCMAISFTKPENYDPIPNRNSNQNINNPQNNNKLTETQEKIIKAALDACEMGYPEELYFNNKNFSNDCSGLIYGIFWSADIDLISAISKESGNGVKRLYKVMDKRGLLHKQKLPNPGDLIFWNNTYGTWGKNPLSHIGIVVSVDKQSGQIEYVHNNTYLGDIRKESMNLFKPHENRPTNNYIRYDKVYKKTAAELFESFGMAWKL